MVPRLSALLTAALAALATASAAADALAFCRATTCETQDDCGGPVDPACRPLRWKTGCVGYAVQEDASGEIPYERARDTLETAFSIWEQTDCYGALPGVAVKYMGKVACDKVEFNLQAGNANVLVFRDDEWPHEDGMHNLALTTVTFDPETGDLYNADIEVNTASYDFIDGGQYDFLSVLTHEAGHFLGLSHSQLPDATMYFAYTDYSTDFRTLSEDDIAAVCTVYPPSDIDPLRCNPIPRHGFASQCGAAQISGCAAAPQGEPARPVLSAAAAAAALAAAALRRASARRRVRGRSGRPGS